MVVNPIYDVARNTYNVFNKSNEFICVRMREREREREKYEVYKMWVVDIYFRERVWSFQIKNAQYFCNNISLITQIHFKVQLFVINKSMVHFIVFANFKCKKEYKTYLYRSIYELIVVWSKKYISHLYSRYVYWALEMAIM